MHRATAVFDTRGLRVGHNCRNRTDSGASDNRSQRPASGQGSFTIILRQESNPLLRSFTSGAFHNATLALKWCRRQGLHLHFHADPDFSGAWFPVVWKTPT